MELLLDVSSPENIYNALLLSIDQNSNEISELIIGHSTYKNYCYKKQKEIEMGIDSDSKV